MELNLEHRRSRRFLHDGLMAGSSLRVVSIQFEMIH